MKHSRPAAFKHIPVIDVAPLFSGNSMQAKSVAHEIRKAAVETGFFYVVNHNIAPDLIDATFMAAKYFFGLPDEKKMAIRVTEESAHRGYMPFSQTKQPSQKRADMKESFNFAFPFQADDPYLAHGYNLIGINQWPKDEEDWRRIIERYYSEILILGHKILEGVAICLDLDRYFFRGIYKHPLVRSRLLHYPPQRDGLVENIGAGEHTDYGTITILWQDDIGGLQVKNRDGQWIDAPKIEGSFVINIGDMLQSWSNDVFVSTPHRVLNTSRLERYSIPTFFDPDYETHVECLPNCSGAGNPPRHSPIIAGEYISARYDGSYAYRQPAKTW